MKKEIRTIAALIVAVTVTMVGVGCAVESDSAQPGIVNQVVDSVAVAIADQIVKTSFASKTEEVEPEAEVEPVAPVGSVVDMVTIDSTVYFLLRDGMIVYDLTDSTQWQVNNGDRFGALTVHGGEVYVGGDRLYKVGSSELIYIETAFTDRITALASYNHQLLIGTVNGLHKIGMTGKEPVFADVSVSSLCLDGDGVWVGTDGQGLFRYDGLKIKKRFLRRDTTLFDFVNDLGYHNGHLYVGTDEALYRYNGGRWTTYTSDDGLPSNRIVAIDASSWVVYLATDAGVVGFFNNAFSRIDKFDGYSVNVIRRIKSDLVAGTEDGKLLLKCGPTLRTLIELELAAGC